METIQNEQIVAQLQNVTLFKGVSPNDLTALIETMHPQQFEQGQVLMKKNEPGDSMYLILSGQLRVYESDSQGNEITLTLWGPGHVVGDFALIDEQPRSAAARADTPLETLMLSRQEFLRFLPEHPSIGMAMLRNLADRVRYITDYLGKLDAFSKRLMTGEYDQALKEFTQTNADDSDVKGLIAAFAQMVHSLQEREAKAKGNTPAG